MVTGISDFYALTQAFRESEVLNDFLIQLAQRRIDAGQSVPGITVEERSVIR